MALVVFATAGLIFFGVRLVLVPDAWVAHGIGMVACLVVLVRNFKTFRFNRKIARPERENAKPGRGKEALEEISDLSMLDDALASERAVLYKHSTQCSVSAWVVDEVLEFARTHPEWTIYVLKVIEQRGLSDAVAERLGVRHESPQAFVIRHGRCVWHASHSSITADSLRQHAA